MNGWQYILLFTFVWSFMSCKPPSPVNSSDGPSIIITNSSGDDFLFQNEDQERYFAPFPFNVGDLITQSDTMEVMLISKRLDRGKQVGIFPLAQLAMQDAFNDEYEVLIATPIDESLRIIDSQDFYDFTVEQFSLKQIVEYWYSNRYGLQGTSVKGWTPASPEDLEL